MADRIQGSTPNIHVTTPTGAPARAGSPSNLDVPTRPPARKASSILSNLTSRSGRSGPPQIGASSISAPTHTDTSTRWDGVVVRTKPTDSKKFAKQTQDALDTIASKPVGHRLLNSIAQSGTEEAGGAPAKFGYKVCIQPAASEKKEGLLDHSRTYIGTNVTKTANEEAASTPGQGGVSGIKWNPQMKHTPDGDRPPFIGLAHELLHAQRNLYGQSKLTSGSVNEGEDYKQVDEHQVVGLSPHEDREFTENKIRAEHGVPARTEYSGLEK